MSKRPQLLITSGALTGKRYELTGECLRLGRSSSNNISVPDEGLSRNHCLFEPLGENGLRVTDLASANGTFVNGRQLGGEPCELHVGDVLEMGATMVRVVKDGEEAEVEPDKTPAKVDLGFGDDEAKPPQPKKRAVAHIPMLSVLAVCAACAVAYLAATFGLLAPAEKDEAKPIEEEVPRLVEVRYEKVEADSNGIFRYALNYGEDGVLSVAVDDVPGENRHVTKSQLLSPAAIATLGEMLDWKVLKDIDREYVGAEPDPPALKSWTLTVVYTTRARTVRIVNIAEPETFRLVREKLEAFSKNELGIWAIQYSREKLVELAREQAELGRNKWEDRDIHRGNLAAAITACREALFYLETVNPKPDFAETVRADLERATAELDRRYADQRFLADRAINMQQWVEAQRELQALMEMIPDRGDDRHREASAKLVDVENRVKKGGE